MTCSSPILHGLESSLFGRGHASGSTFIEINQDPATNDTHSFSYSAYPMMVFDDTVTNPNNIMAPITSMQKDSQNSSKNPDFQV